MDLTGLIAQMTAADTTLQSTAIFVGNIPGFIATAVAAAIANGATAAQLAPVVALGNQIATDSTALLNAVAANTPTPTPTPANLKTAKTGK